MENPRDPGTPPSIVFTDAAAAKLKEVVRGHARPAAGLRLEITGRADGEFQHLLSLVEEEARPAGDVVTEVEGITVFVAPRSAAYVHGIRIHYEFKGPGVSGLEFANPNPLWYDDREWKIQELFDNQINPAIASHGGWVSLLGVEDTTAFVQLGGGCQGCGMANVTLKQGIEATILQVVEGIERVVDQTDHASGDNPYYQPSKK